MCVCIYLKERRFLLHFQSPLCPWIETTQQSLHTNLKWSVKHTLRPVLMCVFRAHFNGSTLQGEGVGGMLSCNKSTLSALPSGLKSSSQSSISESINSEELNALQTEAHWMKHKLHYRIHQDAVLICLSLWTNYTSLSWLNEVVCLSLVLKEKGWLERLLCVQEKFSWRSSWSWEMVEWTEPHQNMLLCKHNGPTPFSLPSL